MSPQTRWAKKNPDRVKAIRRRFYENNKSRIHAERRAWRAQNREIVNERKRAWEKANPELHSMQRARRRVKAMNAKINGDLKYHYDITLKRYDELLGKQGGVCAICKKLEVTRHTKRLVVDHDHTTGKVRGLLCHRCNCGLGYFKDSQKHLEDALAYLVRWDDE
jgi:hypothetical protein